MANKIDAPGQGGVRVRLKRRRHAAGLPVPRYMTDGAAGMDVAAAVRDELVIAPGGFAAVPTGLSVALPAGYELQVRPRSGLAGRHGVTVLNAPGTIDADYRGEIKVLLINHGSGPFTVRRGDRVAQLVLAAVARAEWREARSLSRTRRGTGGFGHSGRAS